MMLKLMTLCEKEHWSVIYIYIYIYFVLRVCSGVGNGGGVGGDDSERVGVAVNPDPMAVLWEAVVPADSNAVFVPPTLTGMWMIL